MSCKKFSLKISENSKKNTCVAVSNKVAGVLQLSQKRDSGRDVSHEFCETFESNFFTEHLWTTALTLTQNYEDSKTCCER